MSDKLNCKCKREGTCQACIDYAAGVVSVGEELKPCKCGCKAYMSTWDIGGSTQYTIFCGTWCVTTSGPAPEPCDSKGGLVQSWSEAEAITAWNTRPAVKESLTTADSDVVRDAKAFVSDLNHDHNGIANHHINKLMAEIERHKLRGKQLESENIERGALEIDATAVIAGLKQRVQGLEGALEKTVPVLQKNALDKCECDFEVPQHPCQHCKLSYDTAMLIFTTTGRTIEDYAPIPSEKGGE